MEVLEKHAQQASAFPKIQARIQQHLAETDLQAKRMQQRLEAYDREPSMLKTAVGNFQGNLVGMMSGFRGDPLSRNMRDEYVTENLEIAGYTYMIETARLIGDEDTVKAAQMTLREEIAMAEWLAAHLTEGLILDFQQQGLDLGATTAATAEKTPIVTVTFSPAENLSIIK
jgi:ferritin-like metal-binding protein YciE